MFLGIIAGIIAVLIAISYYLILPYKYWKNQNVLHPPVSYLFGNVGQALLLKKSFQEVYDEIYKKYPHLPYVGIYKWRSPCILLRDPDLIKQVLVKNFNSFCDNDICVDEKRDSIMARHPFAAKGYQQLKESRSRFSPSFTPKRMKQMFPSIQASAMNLIKYINNNIDESTDGINVKDMFVKYTTDNAASCTLGLDSKSLEDFNSAYIKMNKRVLSFSMFSIIKIAALFYLPPLSKLLGSILIPREVVTFYSTIYKQTMEYRSKYKVLKGDILEGMNKLQEQLGTNMITDEDILMHIILFFLDGTETSSITLTFILYELSLQPQIQENLKIEIEQTLGKCNGELSYDVICQMDYLDQVINENMRKNGAVPFFNKTCTKEFIFKSLDGSCSTTIEPGICILIPIDSIHHDPKYYPNPDKFDPTRFSRDCIEKRTKYTFLPFNEGPRACLGQQFAIMQIKIALIQLIKNFKIKMNAKTIVPYEIHPLYFLHAPKDSIYIDFERRC